MRSADEGSAVGERRLALRHALALGLVQGPTELLPVSSSAHTELLPWLAGWPYARLEGERRKAFEVALHAGAGLALALHMRRELLADAARIGPRRAGVIALSLAPAALAGYALERPIEQRLGGPRSIALGLVTGAIAMAVADRPISPRQAPYHHRYTDPADEHTHQPDPRDPDVRPGRSGRAVPDATAIDGLALGLAQALALAPGVSRNGATLTAARARGFSRKAAQTLSWHTGLPVLLGASALKAVRLHRAHLEREERATLALGGASALASTLVSARLLDRRLREGQALWPYSLYRWALAAAVLARVRGDAARTPPKR